MITKFWVTYGVTAAQDCDHFLELTTVHVRVYPRAIPHLGSHSKSKDHRYPPRKPATPLCCDPFDSAVVLQFHKIDPLFMRSIALGATLLMHDDDRMNPCRDDATGGQKCTHRQSLHVPCVQYVRNSGSTQPLHETKNVVNTGFCSLCNSYKNAHWRTRLSLTDGGH